MKYNKPLFTQLRTKSSLIALLTVISSSTFAGINPPIPVPIGDMLYSIPSQNGPTAVPTLSGTMLILLSLLLFVVAFRIAKQKNNGASKLFITLVGVTAISTGIGGIKLVSDVEAGGSITTIPLDVAPGSTTGSVDLLDGLNSFDNPNSVAATITSINITNETSICGQLPVLGKAVDLSAPICTVGNTVAPDAQCLLFCSSPSGDGGDSF